MPFCTNCGAKLKGNEQACPFCREVIRVNTEKDYFSPISVRQIEELKSEVQSLKQKLTDQRIKSAQSDETRISCCCWWYCIIPVIIYVIYFIFASIHYLFPP
jgi:hypothetical protein